MDKQQRSASIDAIRVLGILAVIAGHVWRGPLEQAALYTWHVPIFFFLSGYLWRPGRPLRTEIRNRWRTIGVPYVAWLAIIGVPYVLAALGESRDIWPVILPMLLGGGYLGRPFSAFWFMTALFFACVLARALERFGALAAWVIAACGVAACTLAPSVVSRIPLSGGVAVAALTFVLAGKLLRQYRERLVRPQPLAWGLLATASILIATGVSRPLDMKHADLGTPLLSTIVACAICTSLVLLAESAWRRVGNKASRGIVDLAVVGTVVVLTHSAVLWVLNTPEVGSALDFVLAVTLPWAAGLLIARTPLAPTLVGIARRPRKEATPRN